MQVTTATPPVESWLDKGPAKAMQELGTIELASEVLDMQTLVILNNASQRSCIVSLSVPDQISRNDANKLTTGMPVVLIGEEQPAMRSEDLSHQFAGLCGSVSQGRLVLGTRAPASKSGMLLS